jgi:hypothetical protein
VKAKAELNIANNEKKVKVKSRELDRNVKVAPKCLDEPKKTQQHGEFDPGSG